MKKGNRVLAMFLAAVMLVTSIAWDFSDASVAEAAETESAAAEGGHVKYDFESITDASSLDNDFTAYQNGATTPDTSVTDYWFLGKTADDAEESYVAGLKPKNRGSVYCMVYNRTYEEFKATVEIYPDTNTQVGIGNVTSSGVSTNTAGALMVWFSSNSKIHYAGMGKSGYKDITAQTTFNLNIRVENSKVTIWLDEVGLIGSLDVDDAFPKQSNIVFRQKRNTGTGGKYGAYKSLEIRDLNTEGYTDFDYVDVSTLTNFTSTKFESNVAVDVDTDVTASQHWFSGMSGTTTSDESVTSNSAGLKTRDEAVYNLNYGIPYKNFKVTLELHNCKNQGIVIGDANQRAVDASAPAVNIWTDGGKINIRGAHDYANASNVGGTLNPATSSSGITTFNVGTFTDVFELNVEVLDGVLKLWITGNDAYMMVPVGSAYPDDSTIALWAKRDGANGGFKSFTVENLDDAYVNFEDADITSLNDYFSSTQLTEDSATGDPIIDEQKDLTVESHWSKDVSTVAGIKPLTHRDDHKHNLLKYKEKYRNFEATIKFTWNTNIGFVIGSAYRYPYATTTDGILIVTNDGNLKVRGAIDTSTANVEGTIKYNKITTNQCLVQMASSTLSPSEQTIHIKLLDGVLTVWLDSSDEVLTVNVASTYPSASNISLWALGYSDKNSFKSFQINNLDDTYMDFDNTDVSTLKDKGYTSTRFKRDTTTTNTFDRVEAETNVDPTNHWFSGTSGTAVDATTALKSENSGLTSRGTDTNNRYYLNTPYAYKNFKISTDLYYGSTVGVALGDTDVSPANASSNDTSIVVYFNDGRLYVCGAIDSSSEARVLKGTNGASSSNNEKTILFKFDQDFYDNRNNIIDEAYTLNVQMLDGILTVWVDGYDGVMSVPITNLYKVGTISLLSRRYSDKGGIKSFAIRELDASINTGTTVDVDGYTDFDNVVVSTLEEKGFKATQYDINGDDYTVSGDVDQSVSTYWAAGADVISMNAGLKPKTLTTDNKITVLNTPYSYENFRISTEIYWGAYSGIVLGERNVYPTPTTANGVRIFFNDNHIQITGAGVDPNTAKVTGGTATWNPNYITTYHFKPASDFTASKGTAYKLNVEMMSGVLTIWVDGYEGVLTINTTDDFTKVENKAIALMGRGYNGHGGGLKSLMVEEIQNLTIPYTADKFADYRSTEGHTAPSYKNYLFAGWFTSTDCTKETAVPASATTVDTETVYAKFVLRDILTVKAQVSSELSDTDLTNDTKGNIRFVTTVDGLNYSKAGFKVAFDSPTEGPVVKTSASKKVYSEMSAMGKTYEPADFCNSSIYFKACTVRGVTEAWYDLTFTVTPFWETLDGTVVTGDTVVKTVNQGMDFEYLNGKSALFVGDSIMKGAEDEPANDFHYLSWAGRLARYYGMSADKVAQSGWSLTSNCPVEIGSTTMRGRIVTQLDKAASKEEGAYDYVILEGGCNDVLTYTNGDQTVMNDKWGTIQTADDAVLDDTTIAGAMQDLIVKAHTAYPNAKLIYIINSEYGLFDADQTNIYNNEARLAQLIKDVCMLYKEKGYDINYIDLSNTTVYPELAPLSLENANLVSEYLPDKLHPNAASYELSTPVIARFLRKVGTGKSPEAVYLSSDESLNDAIDEVIDGGTVYVQGTYAITSNDWVEHGKQVTIASEPDTSATIDLSALSNKSLRVEDAVIFDNITLQFSDTTNGGVMARGHALAVNDDVTFTGKSIKIYGGKDGSVDVDSTQLRLYAGNYTEIYGGGSSGNVKYDTNIIIGGKVNGTVDPTSHDETSYLMFGGVYNGTVKGNTYITVSEGANFHYIFGGSRDSGGVNGSTNIKFVGNAYGIYGGSWNGTVTDTHVEILGGTVAQVFGGCRGTSMTGNTDVQLLGGTITRRVYGGCYNAYDTSGWATTDYVKGHTNVTIGPNVTLALNDSDSDRGVFAGSRYKEAFGDEIGTVIFVDGCHGDKNGKLGRMTDDTTEVPILGVRPTKEILGTPNIYNYLVQATTGGSVTSSNGLLYVTPDDKYTATVTNVTADGDGTYTLSTATNIITVTFTAE